MVLTVAFDYGGHAELMSAVRAARATGGPITQEAIAANLYLPELPPVDLLVRTSGEQRVSNFLLWQSAGATIHFSDAPWPDFDADELDAALKLVQ
jgi:undecaprenyl diphosphate synthase